MEVGRIVSGKPTTWRISGMYCPHCESLVLRAVKDLDGLTEVSSDYRKGTLSAIWDSSVLSEREIAGKLAEAGYELQAGKAPDSIGQRLLRLAGTLAVLAGLFFLLATTPLQALFTSFPVARAGTSLGTLFVVGFMTSVHCLAMCGGINLAQSAGAAQAKQKVFPANVQYNMGRLLSYTAFGAAIGALGSVFRLSSRAQSAIQIAAAVFMLLMALNLLDAEGLRGWFPSLPGYLHGRLTRYGKASSFTIGLLNGLMPCGPLQAMQIYALSTGSWWMGALSMLCFCLGTVPLMLGFGLVSGRLNLRFAKPVRIASGVLVLLMGMVMLNNGLTLAGVSLKAGENKDASRSALAEDIQVVESELDWRSYPDITVRAGIPVRWIIHAEKEKITGCNKEMVIPALELRIQLSPGDNVVEFTVNEPGVIPYTCWMGMLHGSITVEESSG